MFLLVISSTALSSPAQMAKCRLVTSRACRSRFYSDVNGMCACGNGIHAHSEIDLFGSGLYPVISVCQHIVDLVQLVYTLAVQWDRSECRFMFRTPETTLVNSIIDHGLKYKGTDFLPWEVVTHLQCCAHTMLAGGVLASSGTVASSMYQRVVSTRSRHPPEGPDSMVS